MADEFRMKVRAVRFKGGGELRVLDTCSIARRQVERMVRRVLNGHLDHEHDIAGAAFVVWDRQGGSTADIRSNGAGVPSIAMPDFLRARFLAAKIEEWTKGE